MSGEGFLINWKGRGFVGKKRGAKDAFPLLARSQQLRATIVEYGSKIANK
jgi:hypothetical protein